MKIKAVLNLIRHPGAIYRLMLQHKYPIGCFINDKTAISVLYKQRFGKAPNFKNPNTFNEKLLYLTLYDHNPIYTTMVDKYRAKKWISDLIGSEYVVRNIGCWEKTVDIDFKLLPTEYVLKCNHDSGSVIICNNRMPSIQELRLLDKAKTKNYFWFSREWAYKNVDPVIFAEEYIQCKDAVQGVVDYKFYCFNGEPKYVLVISHRSSGGQETFFDLSWNALNVSKGYRRHQIAPQKPKKYDDMKHIASVLSKGIPFLRVDMFEDACENIKIGELTLTPSSGMVPFQPEEYDVIFGNELHLPHNR